MHHIFISSQKEKQCSTFLKIIQHSWNIIKCQDQVVKYPKNICLVWPFLCRLNCERQGGKTPLERLFEAKYSPNAGISVARTLSLQCAGKAYRGVGTLKTSEHFQGTSSKTTKRRAWPSLVKVLRSFQFTVLSQDISNTHDIWRFVWLTTLYPLPSFTGYQHKDKLVAATVGHPSHSHSYNLILKNSETSLGNIYAKCLLL